ncbi:hypothetical protein EK69_003257 [Salmonella enterica subsp. enterica]|nr:hypothetical protein [Salmonella enterica subsp. enterica serovar Baguida]
MNVACDGPSGRGPWMGRVIRSQHISDLKYEGYRTFSGKAWPSHPYILINSSQGIISG